MITHMDIVNEARSWAGTPFVHQGRVKHVGVDCVGILVGVGRRLGLTNYDNPIYPPNPRGGWLREELARAGLFQVPLEQATHGMVALMDFPRGLERHAAILTDRGMIHATRSIGRVVEQRITDAWKRRMTIALDWPNVQGRENWQPSL